MGFDGSELKYAFIRRQQKNFSQSAFAVYSSLWALVGIHERSLLRRHRSCSVSSRFSGRVTTSLVEGVVDEKGSLIKEKITRDCTAQSNKRWIC